MRSRFRTLLLPCLFTFLCPAQSSWPDFIQRWRKTDWELRTPWTLLIRKGDYPDGFARRDPELILLVGGKDLRVSTLDKDGAARLWEAKAWSPEAHWILLSKVGDIQTEGKSTPTGNEVRAFMRSVGYQTVWEIQESFFREHPDNGDALDARLLTSLDFLSTRFRVLIDRGKARQADLADGIPGKLLLDPSSQGAVADELYAEVADTLERLIQLPDWWRLSNRFLLGFLLQSYDAGASPRMRAVIFRMRESLLVEWRKHPGWAAGSNGKTLEESNDLHGLGTIWFQCEHILENGRIAALPSLTPSPGRVWPPWDMVMFGFTLMQFSRDWEGMLAFLDKVPLDYLEPPVSSEQWDEMLMLRTMVASQQVIAFAQLGRWDQARSAAQEARRWAGQGWREHALSENLTKLQKEGAEAKDSTSTPLRKRLVVPEDLLEILSSEPEPNIPAPLPPTPIRMVLRGTPTWQKEWRELRSASPLAQWGPDELRWEPAVEADGSVLDRLTPKPVWAAMKDDGTILASGNELPDPRALALQLATGGQTKLQRLGKFIRTNPEHMDARRDRFALQLARMPNPALEPLLAEDAATAWIPPNFEPSDTWTPRVELWQARATKVMPELEAALRRWPRSPKLWKAWIAWARFLPSPPSVHRMALSMEVLGSRLSWMAGLPKEIHTAVADELRRKSQFQAMRTWFQEAWDGNQKNQPDAISFPEVSAAREEAIFKGLAEALSAMKMKEALAELNRQRKISAPKGNRD